MFCALSLVSRTNSVGSAHVRERPEVCLKPLAIDRGGRPCSFCGVSRPPRQVIVTDSARAPRICEVCIRDCGEILGEELAAVQPPDAPDTSHLPAVEAPDFLEQLTRIMSGIDALGDARLSGARRAAEPERRAPRPMDRCSFCSRSEIDVARLITGPKVKICEVCVIAAAHVHDRFKLRQRYGALYDELITLFFHHDPMGLDAETNTDEYSPEVRAILLRLASCSSVEDVASLLYGVFIEYFDEKLAGPRSSYERMAPSVWDLWKTHAKSRS